jgi:hypothetical protein
MRESAAPYVQPGENIQAVFGAQTTSQYLAGLTGWIVFFAINRYRIVVPTDRRILVLDAGKTSMKKARGIVAELPRSTQLGPPTGVWHAIPVAGERLRVHRRFFKDIQQADSLVTPSAAGDGASPRY